MLQTIRCKPTEACASVKDMIEEGIKKGLRQSSDKRNYFSIYSSYLISDWSHFDTLHDPSQRDECSGNKNKLFSEVFLNPLNPFNMTTYT